MPVSRLSTKRTSAPTRALHTEPSHFTASSAPPPIVRKSPPPHTAKPTPPSESPSCELSGTRKEEPPSTLARS